MTKNITYTAFLLIFLTLTSFMLWNKYSGKTHDVQKQFLGLKERPDPLAKLPEWNTIRRQGNILLEKIKARPDDRESKLALVALFIQEGRVTGNHGYYDMASLKYLDDILATDSTNFDALVYKAVVELSQHQFENAEKTAATAMKRNPYNAFVHGLLVDANLELGKYAEAIKYADEMVSIRPDLRSYSRIAYLREIYGDLPGAIEAMEMAVDAGVPGEEATEWCRVQLGNLYLKTRQTEKAAMQFHISLQERPTYAFAIAGLGKVELETKNFTEAIAYLKTADSIYEDPSFQQELAFVYQAKGEKSAAKKIFTHIIQDLEKHEHENSHSHHADLELAEIYLHAADYQSALHHALIEYKRRPGNIEVNEVLAWAYYKSGDQQRASMHMKKAMATNCKDPVLLERAAVMGY